MHIFHPPMTYFHLRHQKVTFKTCGSVPRCNDQDTAIEESYARNSFPAMPFLLQNFLC